MARVETFAQQADYIQTASGNKAHCASAYLPSSISFILSFQVSRNSVLCGSQNISLVGNSVVKPEPMHGACSLHCDRSQRDVRPGVVLRGDLQLLKIGLLMPARSLSCNIACHLSGKFVIIGDGCVLRPSYKKYKAFRGGS